jgi:peptidyl-prolyl cis-trans isomerase B (cyclophilin B)
LLATLLAALLAAPVAPEISVPTGAPILHDGRIEEAEWADASLVTQANIRLRLKRTGPWLALALEGEGRYAGEMLRICTTDASGAWITSVLLGLGQAELPPALWRRAPPHAFSDPGLGPGEPPRACLARLDVGQPERWAAEVLLRLGALGIGRGDLRELRGAFLLHANDPDRREVLTLPAGVTDAHDAGQFARLVSPDGWGAAEAWPPVTPEQSREFDDNELLYRLSLEQEMISTGQTPDRLIIEEAVRPRSMGRINALRRELEACRARNPTLPAWTNFLGRLLHEGNLYGEARKIVESIPPPLRRLPPFPTLAAEHFAGTELFGVAEEIWNAYPYARGQPDGLKLARKGRRMQEAERLAVERDGTKPEKNPRLRFKTAKGDLIVELFEDDAPHAVRNLMDLVLRRKYYDGLRFHVEGARVAVIGDPRARDGGDQDGPPWRVRLDPSPRAPLTGYLAAMPAKGGVSHGSQFFLALAPVLEGRPVVFGRVVEGMDALLSLEHDDLLDRIDVISRRNHAYDPADARQER